MKSKLSKVRQVKMKSNRSADQRARPFTEIFSVRTDIPPEVVCASFGDHCMEQNAYLR